MNSRYGFWIMSICWIGLAGCSNWQNRINSGPGTAAGFTAAPAATNAPLMQGPGSGFGEPPPPIPPPPSDPGMSLEPLANPASQRLDLSAVEPAGRAAPERMYNLEGPKAPAQKSGLTSAERSVAGSSTISKLASKAKPSVSKSSSSADSIRSGTTLERLSSQASKPRTADADGSADTSSRDSVASKTATPNSDVSAPAPVDTTFLAQPVRKGASSNSGSDSNNSKGPQSNVLPGTNRLLNGNSKPAIYPVSNPVAEEPVDTTQFS